MTTNQHPACAYARVARVGPTSVELVFLGRAPGSVASITFNDLKPEQVRSYPLGELVLLTALPAPSDEIREAYAAGKDVSFATTDWQVRS